MQYLTVPQIDKLAAADAKVALKEAQAYAANQSVLIDAVLHQAFLLQDKKPRNFFGFLFVNWREIISIVEVLVKMIKDFKAARGTIKGHS